MPMGGSLLSVYTAMRYSEKHAIRKNVALGYAIFAATQLIVLSLTGNAHTSGLINPFAAGIIRFSSLLKFAKNALRRSDMTIALYVYSVTYDLTRTHP
jgi:hypothetical protein